MTQIDSRTAMLHFEMIEAIRRALNRESDPDGFMQNLHRNGFMVVPIPLDADPEPIEPERPNAATPNAEAAPEARMTNGNTEWVEWLAQARSYERTVLVSGTTPMLKSDLRREFDRGTTPKAAIDDEVPF